MLDQERIKEMIELQRKVDRDQRQFQLNVWMNLHLSIGQLKTLFFISNCGTVSISKLAEALEVRPANVTSLIDRMLERGLITRTGDPNDRRVLLLRTTPKGDELVAELRQKRQERMAEVFNHLNDEEASIVIQGLRLMVKAIEH